MPRSLCRLRRSAGSGYLAVPLVLGLAAGLAWAGAPARLPSELPAPAYHRLGPIADTATLATRVEAEPFPARRDVFEFLLDHPEFATHVTRILRLARYRIWRTPEGLHIDDGWGTRGRFDLVHSSHGLRVLHAWGRYEHWLFPSIAGEAIVVIEYASRPGIDGHGELLTIISGFVKLANPLLAAAGRLASAVAIAKAEREGRRLARLFARTSRAIEDDPVTVVELLERRSDVPRADLEAFRRLVSLPRPPMP